MRYLASDFGIKSRAEGFSFLTCGILLVLYVDAVCAATISLSVIGATVYAASNSSNAGAGLFSITHVDTSEFYSGILNCVRYSQFNPMKLYYTEVLNGALRNRRFSSVIWRR